VADGKKIGAGTAVITSILAAIFAVEGGYVNDPRDPGGETNMGITKTVAREHGYTGPMRDLPKATAADIYTRTYIDAPGYRPMVEIEPVVAEELVDTAVNMGQSRPSRWFQQSINDLCGDKLAVDGKVGPATIAAYIVCQGKLGRVPLCKGMLARLDAKQKAEYDRLVRVNPALKVYYKGWTRNRIGNASPKKCGSDVL